jgi:Flp pilus assembly protein TadD
MLSRRRADWRAYKQIALFYESQGRYDEAIGLLKGALELTPDNAEIWGTLGTVYMLKGRFAEAQTSYERSIEIEPTTATLVNLSGVYERNGQAEQALKAVIHASERPDASFQVWNSLAQAYARRGKTTELRRAATTASKLAARAVEATPRNTTPILSLATSKMLLGDMTDAVRLSEWAVELQPRNPRVLGAAAAIFAEAGRAQRAAASACSTVELGMSATIFASTPKVLKAVEEFGPCTMAELDRSEIEE